MSKKQSQEVEGEEMRDDDGVEEGDEVENEERQDDGAEEGDEVNFDRAEILHEHYGHLLAEAMMRNNLRQVETILT